MRHLWICVAGGLLVAGCDVQKSAGGNQAEAQAGTPEEIVASVEDSWRSGSAETAMALYAPDAVVFSTGKLAPTRDRNVITQETAGFMAMKPADFAVTERNVQQLDPDTLVASGVVSFTAQVGPARQMARARFTQVLQKQADGRWLIVHEHMSLPPAGAPLP
ncbi:YybH family protein [Sphingomonas mesophila]|uniref:YybH family protein n=1 Tax=Sphingomonas mesophila TaxID=2303576 RepID=UPI000E56D148|nr:SgcJ/EcaC family oxidoreductase [Sphingomonas mesophila]